MTFNYRKAQELIDARWDNSILPVLSEYVRIPCKSPCFDPDWEKNGYIDQAIDQFMSWCESQEIRELSIRKESIIGRSPVLFVEINGSGHMASNTAFFYGHLDKQPEAEGWDANKGVWKPVIENSRLYGRGAADDGYAFFSVICAIKTLQTLQVDHARCVIIIESGEEGGSVDLPAYFEKLSGEIGTPDIVICLDSDCGNYDQLWVTTSLRGIAVGDLRVDVLTEGIHSGSGSGVVASSFRIIRQLIERVEETATGRILVKELWADIPDERVAQAKRAAQVIGDQFIRDLPLRDHSQPVSHDVTELILNRSWKPTLSTIGADGFPKIKEAGNVLRPFSAFKLSFRLPPTVDDIKANAAIKKALEANPPYGATVSYTPSPGAKGWNATRTQSWFETAIEESSRACFGKEAVFFGEGGSIPFIGLLNEMFPEAQFLVTGILGPNSNAHGPNEFLDINTVKKITCVVSGILAAHTEVTRG